MKTNWIEAGLIQSPPPAARLFTTDPDSSSQFELFVHLFASVLSRNFWPQPFLGHRLCLHHPVIRLVRVES